MSTKFCKGFTYKSAKGLYLYNHLGNIACEKKEDSVTHFIWGDVSYISKNWENVKSEVVLWVENVKLDLILGMENVKTIEIDHCNYG